MACGVRKEERNLLCAKMEYLLCAGNGSGGVLDSPGIPVLILVLCTRSLNHRDQTCVPGASGERVATKT